MNPVIINLTDMLGRQVYEKAVDSPVSSGKLNISGIARGMYMIRIANGEEEVSQRLVVK